MHPNRAGTGLFVHTTFQGNLSEWPKEKSPTRVAMVQSFVGEVAHYEVKSDKFSADEKLWNLGSQIMNLSRSTEFCGNGNINIANC